jgi:Leucine-rich repeat (LRR) protein
MLTCLPSLKNISIRQLYCNNNELTYLPQLDNSLKVIECANNFLTSIPSLPYGIDRFVCENNPVHPIIHEYSILSMSKNIEKWNKFRYLYFRLKMRKNIRRIVFEKIRQPKIEIAYHPSRISELLDNNDINDIDDEFEEIEL